MVGRRNLGVWDTAFRGLDQSIEAVQENRDNTNRWIEQENRDERFTDQVTNVDRQLGKWMSREKFKQVVESISDKLKVDYHPRLPTMAVCEVKWAMPWEVDPVTKRLGGLQKVFKMGVGSLKAPIIPEWSLLESKKALSSSGESIRIPSKVIAQGWRRALVTLVKQGYLTRQQAEKLIDEYGSPSAESAAWQTIMGYRQRDGREFVY